MCNYLGISFHTRAAESSWSNRVIETNNQTLAIMVDAIINDSKCSLELVLVRALNPKKTIQNLAGFSHF